MNSITKLDPKKVLVLSDSFKGSLNQKKIDDIFKNVIKENFPNVQVKSIPVSDGGEGTVKILSKLLKGELVETKTKDPLLRNKKSCFGIFEIDNKKTALIEMAEASGIEKISKEERNPLKTSSFGTGELIKKAISKGAEKIILTLGGSATNDGGMGMLEALGMEFLDEFNRKLPGKGENLLKIKRISKDKLIDLSKISFEVLTDVKNPLLGKTGATFVFGNQKGGSLETLDYLERGMKNFSFLLENLYKKQGYIEKEGAGAAGGIGFSSVIVFNCKIFSVAKRILELLNVEKEIKNSDLVITGEGKLDKTTLNGKIPFEVIKLAEKNNVPVIIITGTKGEGYNEFFKFGVKEVISLEEIAGSIEGSLKEPEKYYKEAVLKLF